MTKNFIYLASASPRRSALLDQIGVPHRILPASIDEARRAGESPRAYAERVACDKADAVWRIVGGAEPAPVLAADTTVVLGDDVLGKPDDTAEALEMLASLSGCTHTVLTAVAWRWESLRDSLVTSSEVRFRATTEDERRAYCQTEEPLGKAGAYAIQGLGAAFIEHLSGSYSSVMGLPLRETADVLRQFGLPAWLNDGATCR